MVQSRSYSELRFLWTLKVVRYEIYALNRYSTAIKGQKKLGLVPVSKPCEAEH